MISARDAAIFAAGAAAAVVGSLIFTATQAKAEPWTGCYAGGLGSYNAAVLDGGGFGAEGPGIAATVGCDIQRNRFVGGALAEYGYSTFDLWDADVDLKGWSLGVRGGVLIWEHTLAYGLVKWVDVDASMDDGDNTIALSGLALGGGTEVALGGGFFTRMEYTYSMLEPDEDLHYGPDDIQANVHSARLGFIYKFGGPDVLPAAAPLK